MSKLSEFYLNQDYPGVVFECLGHPLEVTINHYGDVIREEEDVEQAIIRMVGDSRKFVYYIDDLVPYEGEVCTCGQEGCGHAY